MPSPGNFLFPNIATTPKKNSNHSQLSIRRSGPTDPAKTYKQNQEKRPHSSICVV